jgi:GT2 family glycosyltransferase
MGGKAEDELLFKCIQSIVSKTEYSNYEILVGYNNKMDFEIENFLKSYPHRAINYKLNSEFNFANKINFMAKNARGEHLVIFNDDLEVIAGEWLSSLLEFSQQEEVGVVGSKLLFPDGKLQHVGMIIGINGYPAHIYHSAKPDFPGYRGDANLIRNYSAVTGAAMMVKKKLFDELKGLDENFRIDYNDTDFCMRVMEKGYRNVYTPYSLFYHHESAVLSSGRLNKKETELFQKKWKKYLNNDPFYNPNLTKKSLDYSLDLCPI